MRGHRWRSAWPGRLLWALCIGGVLLLAACDGRVPWQAERPPVATDAGIRIVNTDSAGNAVVGAYAKVPERVLVTYPGATELLIDLGVQQAIVGTVAPYGAEPAVYDAAYRALPILDAPYVPSREEVTALRPDVIIGWSHHFTPAYLGDVRQWQAKGIGTYIVPATLRKNRPTLESTVYPFIDDMGRLFGISERAAAYKAALSRRVQAVVERGERRRQAGFAPTVLILQAHGHSTYSLYGPVYIIDDVVKKAGGRNLVDRQISQVGPERILAFDPDYIVFVYAGDGGTAVPTEATMKAALTTDRNLRHMRAVTEGRIIPVPFSDVNNGNGRTVYALEKIDAVFEKEYKQ